LILNILSPDRYGRLGIALVLAGNVGLAAYLFRPTQESGDARGRSPIGRVVDYIGRCLKSRFTTAAATIPVSEFDQVMADDALAGDQVGLRRFRPSLDD
jgi:hypothetical protein